jgi:interleukin 1 receptor-like 1
VNLFNFHLGKTVNITCSACFGKGNQSFAGVLWQVNRSRVRDFGEARIQEEEEQNQRYFCIQVKTSFSTPTQFAFANKTLRVTCCFLSYSSVLSCLNKNLRISDFKEEDLSLEYDCVAWNFRGIRRHTIRLSRKKPSKECF